MTKNPFFFVLLIAQHHHSLVLHFNVDHDDGNVCIFTKNSQLTVHHQNGQNPVFRSSTFSCGSGVALIANDASAKKEVNPLKKYIFKKNMQFICSVFFTMKRRRKRKICSTHSYSAMSGSISSNSDRKWNIIAAANSKIVKPVNSKLSSFLPSYFTHSRKLQV